MGRTTNAFFKISKSSYEYQHKAISRPDKYASLRAYVRALFDAHDARWSSERIWTELRRAGRDAEPLIVSEKNQATDKAA